jgi:hypothetical protein
LLYYGAVGALLFAGYKLADRGALGPTLQRLVRADLSTLPVSVVTVSLPGVSVPTGGGLGQYPTGPSGFGPGVGEVDPGHGNVPV